MKVEPVTLSKLIKILQGFEEEYGDVEIEFDWGVGTSLIWNNEVKFDYNNPYSEKNILSFLG
jgi:hypothetical protein